MLRVLIVSFTGLFLLLPIGNALNALLPAVQNNKLNEQIESHKNKDTNSIEDLLGPKDNFPFLPDNHRDSGTGKFNAFN